MHVKLEMLTYKIQNFSKVTEKNGSICNYSKNPYYTQRANKVLPHSWLHSQHANNTSIQDWLGWRVGVWTLKSSKISVFESKMLTTSPFNFERYFSQQRNIDLKSCWWIQDNNTMYPVAKFNTLTAQWTFTTMGDQCILPAHSFSHH